MHITLACLTGLIVTVAAARLLAPSMHQKSQSVKACWSRC